MAFVSTIVALIFSVSARAQLVAYDDASPYYTVNTWTNGANNGFGFLPWTLVSSGPNNAGTFTYTTNVPKYVIASVTNISGVNWTNVFGLFANGTTGTNESAAYRPFAAPLGTNTFKLQWGARFAGVTTVNGTQVHGWCGWTLRNGNATNTSADFSTGARFSLYFLDGSVPNTVYVRDANGAQSLTGVTFSALGRKDITNAISAEITVGADGQSYHLLLKDSVIGQTLYTLDGTLAGTGTIDSVALFCYETTGDQIYNRLQIAAPHVAPSITSVQPTNGSIFINPAGGVSFQVHSLSQNLLGANVSLTLNGVATPLTFNTTNATDTLFAINATPLASNLQYSATIIATDTEGDSATNSFSFNTYQPDATWQDVKTFGATGNGVTLDTTAIQAAINACPSNGYVWLHNGTYLSGTISLKSDMTLYIDPTATLFGSGSVADYPDQFPPLTNSQTLNCKKALVLAQSCTNLAILGGGTINGNGRNNFTSGLEATRPIAIWPVLCQHVNIQDIKIVDASMWTLVPFQTDFITISNVNINDDGLNGNRDGIDPVDCWHVTITDCTIDSGDDSICLKSGNSKGVNDVLVKNCTVTRSQSNGFKFGTASTGPFTNIVFQDCSLQNVSHSVMAVESVDGSSIRNVTFQRINFTGCQNAIFVILGSRAGAKVGTVDGITYRDITGSGMADTRGCPISGTITNGVTYYVKNLLFDNVNITFSGGLGSVPAAPPEYVGQYPENTMWGNEPAYGYYLRHVTNATFINCFPSVAATDSRPWMATNDTANIILTNAIRGSFSGSYNSDGMNLRYTNGIAAGTYYLQASTNLLDWITLSTNPPGNGPFQFTDPQSTTRPYRFYRLSQ